MSTDHPTENGDAVTTAAPTLPRIDDMARPVHAGWLSWPMTAAPAVLRTWADWSATLAAGTTSRLHLLRLPAAPGVPEPLRGREVVMVDVIHEGASVRDVIAPLTALGPEVSTVRGLPRHRLAGLQAAPADPASLSTTAVSLAVLDDDAVEAVLALASPDAPVVATAVRVLAVGGDLGTAYRVTAEAPSPPDATLITSLSPRTR